MNHATIKMCRRILYSVAVVVSLSFASLYAYGELQEYGDNSGRSYHAKLYKKGKCSACHGVQEPVGYPEDDACLKCHDVDELVVVTMPDDEEDRWQNPHDNLHYGTEVPCVECHGEHTNKTPLCADCHNFDYPDHEL